MRCFILFLIVPVLVIAEPSCTAVKTHVKTYNQGQPLDTVHSKALDELRDIARDATSNPDLDPFGSESPLHRVYDSDGKQAASVVYMTDEENFVVLENGDFEKMVNLCEQLRNKSASDLA
ncbi:unnamed protein product [Heligmosomoides polygyrus]|uniref:SCP domain-containing protein n=1 Tax=Heligmosomoides polygyrus TaxID=6339 RepID=A0A183F706_HELPZ|nr:unnamed protein product [Heligmosomoides polygyrus]